MENEINQLITTYEKLFISRAYAITGSAEDAHDVVQDVFIKYIKVREKGTQVETPKNWFYTAIRNRSIDLIRRRTRKHEIENDSVHQSIIKDHFLSSEKTPTTILIDLEKRQLGQDVLSVLSDRELKIVELRFQDKRSYKEISTTLKLTVTNVGFILNNSIKKLKSAVKLIN